MNKSVGSYDTPYNNLVSLYIIVKHGENNWFPSIIQVKLMVLAYQEKSSKFRASGTHISDLWALLVFYFKI